MAASGLREDDLEGAGVRSAAEDVVGVEDVWKGEVVGGELRRIQLPGTQQLKQGGGGPGVNKTCSDGDIAGPQVF